MKKRLVSPCCSVFVMQQSVGVLAAAVMKTGSDTSYSMTSLPSHHARGSHRFLPHLNTQTHTALHLELLESTWRPNESTSHPDTIPLKSTLESWCRGKRHTPTLTQIMQTVNTHITQRLSTRGETKSQVMHIAITLHTVHWYGYK